MQRVKDIVTSGTSVFLATYNYNLGDWFDGDFQNVVNNRLFDLFGERELFEETIDRIRYQVQWLLIANAYKYNTLYDTTVAEYNPMENYDMHETITTTGTAKTGSQTNTGNDQSNVFAFDSTSSVHNAEATDYNIMGERNDQHSESTQSDKHGNLGVMAGQDLIEKSRGIASFSIVDIMATDIAHCISLAIY